MHFRIHQALATEAPSHVRSLSVRCPGRGGGSESLPSLAPAPHTHTRRQQEGGGLLRHAAWAPIERTTTHMLMQREARSRGLPLARPNPVCVAAGPNPARWIVPPQRRSRNHHHPYVTLSCVSGTCSLASGGLLCVTTRNLASARGRAVFFALYTTPVGGGWFRLPEGSEEAPVYVTSPR